MAEILNTMYPVSVMIRVIVFRFQLTPLSYGFSGLEIVVFYNVFKGYPHWKLSGSSFYYIALIIIVLFTLGDHNSGNGLALNRG